MSAVDADKRCLMDHEEIKDEAADIPHTLEWMCSMPASGGD